MNDQENILDREEVKEFNQIFDKFLKEVSKNFEKAGFSKEFISNIEKTTTTKNAWVGWRGDKDPGGIIWEFKCKLSDYGLEYKDIESKIEPIIKDSVLTIHNTIAPNFNLKMFGFESGINNTLFSIDFHNYSEERPNKEEHIRIPTKQEILDWLSEDKENWEDFINYFGKIYDPISDIDIDELLYWIDYHNLDRQFQTKFGISTYDIPYEDRTLGEDLEEAMTNREKLMKKFPELKLNEDAEMTNTKLNKQEVLDWISEHDLAWEDFVNYFEDIYQSSAEVPIDEIMGWISDHDDLAEDFENKFGISVNADVYDDDCDWFEDELEEHIAIDKYDQINSSSVVEVKPSKLKESVEGKWNIGSNKLVSTDSQEYANLVDLAKLLQERSPNGYEYRVEKTYEDFGAGMQWYTIICDEKNGWGTHQVLNTKQWLDLANTGDVEGVYQDVISNKYFQDTAEKGSMLNTLYMFDE